jgi:hypothetical protein
MTIWTSPTSTNLTTSGSRTVNCTSSSSTGTRTISTSSAAGTESAQVNFNVTAGSDTLTIGSGCRTLDLTGFSGTLTNSARVVYGNLIISSGVTLNSGNNTTTFAATSGTQQVTTNGKTLNFPITQNGIGGTLELQDSLTMGSTRTFTLTNGTLRLKNGVTSTVGAFATSGTNQKFLRSTLAGSQATLSQSSGTVNATYLTIQDINATGGATWNARTDLGSKDISNNTGWNFIFIGVQQILKPILKKILKPILVN